MSGIENGVSSDPALFSAGTMELAVRAAHDGANDARAAAERSWSATNLFLCRFLYTTCYTISYGVVFPATLLARSIPKDNAAVRGFRDGAQAARSQLDQLGINALEHAPSASESTLSPSPA